MEDAARRRAYCRRSRLPQPLIYGASRRLKLRTESRWLPIEAAAVKHPPRNVGTRSQ